MNMRHFRIGASIACFLLACSPAIASSPSASADISKALASAKKIVLYSLEPGESEQRGANGECVGLCYFGWPVLGHVDISPRARVLKNITAWLKNPAPYEQALCFDPRHGVRVITAETTLDFVVCFECDAVRVYSNSKLLGAPLFPSNAEVEWDLLLTRAGVKLASPEVD